MWTTQQIVAMQYAAAAAASMALQMQPGPLMPPPNSDYPMHQNQENASDTEDEDDEEKRILFCANLDERVTEEILYEVFLQAGPIESVRIPKDNGGRQRTFGFITYTHQCSAPYAVRLLNGLNLFNKTLTIRSKINTNPPTPQKRHSLPADCEIYNKRRNESNYSNDNSSLRNPQQHPAYYDLSMNNTMQPQSNPFRSSSTSASSSDWVKGTGGGQSNKGGRMNPYQRHDSSGRSAEDLRNSRKDKNDNNDHQRRHHHSGSDRRSEQRHSNRR